MKKKGEKLDKKTGTKKWLVINRMLDRRRNEKERRPSVGCIYWQQSFLRIEAVTTSIPLFPRIPQNYDNYMSMLHS
ncbi:hypothetical protein OUZ56_021351 [Daphnia magna]|uniref:Uncharacterized protein n=1 Tax=Daphnia magna TaxID=35525 RepID=A0ABQ9ZI62_9CRUS|nr:hypothetical protein OUZ56_021351 [Daphnia magna]